MYESIRDYLFYVAAIYKCPWVWNSEAMVHVVVLTCTSYILTLTYSTRVFNFLFVRSNKMCIYKEDPGKEKGMDSEFVCLCYELVLILLKI